MLVNAMEVSGIDGTFRTTCESVMHVLRKNKNSVMALLEAFVYDPLINWRLLEMTTKGEQPPKTSKADDDKDDSHKPQPTTPLTQEAHPHPREMVIGSAISHTALDRRRSIVEVEEQENRMAAAAAAAVAAAAAAGGTQQSNGTDEEMITSAQLSIQNEQLSTKAVQVIARVESKVRTTTNFSESKGVESSPLDLILIISLNVFY